MTPAERRVLGRYLLVQARERHARVNTFTARHYAVDAAGRDVSPTSQAAVAWCPRGLLWRECWEIGYGWHWGLDRPEPAGVAVAEVWLARAIDPNALQWVKPAAVITPWAMSGPGGAVPLDTMQTYDRAIAIATAAIEAFDPA